MKKILILFCAIGTAFAGAFDEAVLASARAQGTSIYYACIINPPEDPAQQAACEAAHLTYVFTLRLLNAPYPLVPSTDPDPYSWSLYDICTFEVGHIIFGEQLVLPYCTTL